MATKKLKQPKKTRAWELDLLRGLAIIMVVWDHSMYDMGYVFGDIWQSSGGKVLNTLTAFATDYFNSGLRFFWWPIFVFIFFFVSGICTQFSKNNFIRGAKLLLIAIGITIFTYIIESVLGVGDTLIIFGVIHCLACCILFFAVVELILRLINKKDNKWIKAIVYLAVASVLLILDKLYNIPFNLATNTGTVVDTNSFIAGFFVYTRDVWMLTADYFPMLPFLGFFMLGASVSPLLYPNKQSLLPKLDGKWHYPLTLPGKYSLIIYLSSQILVIAILALVTYIACGSFFI